jgi:putative two-component system response regulator
MTEGTNSRKKILLVDDDEIHLAVAESLLEKEYKIFKAMSGHGALEFLGKSQIIPDLILLDIIMLEMDGWEVFKRIKEIAQLKDVPIVFLTSVDEDGEKRKALKLGAAEYIVKPYNALYLKNTIKEIIKSP